MQKHVTGDCYVNIHVRLQLDKPMMYRSAPVTVHCKLLEHIEGNDQSAKNMYRGAWQAQHATRDAHAQTKQLVI